MSALGLLTLALLAQNVPGEIETPDGDILYTVPATDKERLEQLEQRVQQLEQRPAAQAAAAPERSWVTWFGYGDFGFFFPEGSGAGYLQDHANHYFPQYANKYAWVFYGDILAPAVNSRGEVADLGDAPGVNRFDSIHSRGAPGFILNVANFGARAIFTDDLIFTTSVNFTPRSGSDFSLGDFLDLDLAQLEWMPTADHRISIFAGKMESVMGVEYRQRRAPDRFGVTPSLLARYTTGTPLGVKVRGKFFKGDFLTIAAALTNGSSTTEQFHFYDEIDSNSGKTLSGRLSLKPFGLLDSTVLGDLELGVSGEWGPQDRAFDNANAMWFVGVDLLWNKGPVGLEGQWLRGMAKGEASQNVYGLRLNQGAYLTFTWRITPLFGILLRGEYRDALVWLADQRLYITKSYRATFGVRLTINEHLALKAEYLLNGEYGGVPYVPNDIFTSSLVATF
ncbi:MAG: hypothetical protein QM723_31695 [Myxococcaceae bacterium]